MSAYEIVNFVIAIDDPGYTTVIPSLVDASISYYKKISSNIRTLSSKDATSSDVLQGFLYIPDLNSNDPCNNITLPYIPANATRQVNLPQKDYNLVALLPWVTKECTVSFFKSTAYDPIRAFIVYLPDNGTEMPPSIDSEVWDLNDGGRWRTSAQYPVYAVPGSIGSHMMYQLSLYSGNVTSVPNGQIIYDQGVDSNAYIRLYSKIAVSSSPTLPALWVFVLVSFAMLVALFAGTSYSVQIMQRGQRNALRRRVMAGEVDLEALGITRLTVPREKIEEMPLFFYACGDLDGPAKSEAKDKSDVGPDDRPENHGRVAQGSKPERLDGQDDDDLSSPLSAKEPSRSSGVNPRTDVPDVATSSFMFHDHEPEAQSRCPICLDGFESHVTIVRELYCGHIFHPECIDAFLSENSSLCPMCKTSALPIGYCPDIITNAMVRRERAIRRLRSHLIEDYETTEGSDRTCRILGRRVFSRFPRYGLDSSIEMSIRSSEPARYSHQQTSHLSREEFARLRSRELASLS